MPDSQQEESRMPLLDHLRELRSRLIRAAIAIGLGCAAAYVKADLLFGLLTLPLREVSQGRVLLIGTGIEEAFFTKLKVALIAGLFLASPVVFYQIWRFVAPGLYTAERRLAVPFVATATLFFLLGAYFCWAVVFKLGYSFFLSQYASIGVRPTIRITRYLRFSAKLLLGFGVTFELPIFTYFLVRLGLIDYRMMLRHFRYAVLAIFVLAAALTPPDMLSQFLLAIPLLLLYGASVGVAYLARSQPAPVPVEQAPDAG